MWLRNKLFDYFNSPLNPLNISIGHCLIADNAFPLEDNLMVPHSKDNLTREQMIFDYRLSR